MVIIRLVLALVLATGVVPVLGLWLSQAVDRVWRQGLPPAWAALALGLTGGIAFALWRRPNRFVHTFIHETAHSLLCLLLWVRVRRFFVSDREGGYVLPAHTDPLRETLILIAPYILPVLLTPVLLARWLFGVDGPLILLQAACGWLLVHHLHGLTLNIRHNFFGRDADLPRVGRPLAVVLIAMALLTLATIWLQVVWSH